MRCVLRRGMDKSSGCNEEDQIVAGIEESVWLCAERGWRIELNFKDGEKLGGQFITATDEQQKVIVVERPGERQKPARIVYLKDLASVTVNWNKNR